MSKQIQLSESWKEKLLPEFDKDYMKQLRAFLLEEKAKGKTIYPAGKNIFAALDSVSFDEVKVVIIGQDPYHGPGQAHGLSFSVPEGQALPPSLKNIYREIRDDLGIAKGSNGNLLPWAKQGVLLLNSVLTVEAGRAGSHQGKGWERFTDKIIALLNEHREGLVFLLWGAYAHKKGAMIDDNRHLVLKTVHPSPLSAHRGFLGCGHFSRTNDYLQERGLTPIQW